MQFFAIASLALASVAFAQTRDDIPACALPCLDAAVKSVTTCAIDDYACICASYDAVQGAATGCVVDACGFDVAFNQVVPITQAICDNL